VPDADNEEAEAEIDAALKAKIASVVARLRRWLSYVFFLNALT
jgi:hypothetical protein